MEPILYWITALIALIGVWLNIRKNVTCFYLWAGTNATWAYVDFTHGIYSQAALQATYFALSIVGIWKWKTPNCKKHQL